MTAKQTAPLLLTLPSLAAAAPPLIVGGLIVGAIYLVLDSLFPGKQKQPEAMPVPATTDSRKLAETALFRQIPAEIPAIPAPVPLRSTPRAVILTPAVRSIPTASVSVPALAIVPAITSAPKLASQPVKRKLVTREDLATVFNCGARSLTRTAAVAALKRLGFGKTAAYAALTPDGRFANLLRFAPDGMITWMGGQMT